MQKIRLGRTEMMVSRLGFGGIPIQRDSEEEAIAVVKKCLELGITFLDTAYGYTTSEERIGKAISGQREELILATKSPARNSDDLRSHLDLSLKRLGVKYIDLYQFHNVSDSKSLEMILAPNGPMAVLEEAKKEGKIRHIGITSHQIDTAKEAVKSDHFETIMYPFNFIAYEPAEELLKLARDHDVGFIAMKPLAGGMLNNVTLAFKYLLQFPDVLPIPGIQQIDEIEEIVQVLNGSWQMTEAELHKIQLLREELGTSFCRRCDYCQPCTMEIPISMVMGFATFLRRIPTENIFSGWLADTMEKAANCTECGECEERCPYQLPIREIMAEHVARYREEKRRYQESPASR